MTHHDRPPARAEQERDGSSPDPAAAGRAAPTALVAPMRRTLRTGAISAAIALPVAVLLGYLIDGVPGAWGAGIGMGIAVAFFAVTVVVALATARLDPTALGIWVLASWLVKVAILIGVLALLRGSDFYSRPALFAALLVGTIGSLLLESLVVVRTRVPYVEPQR